MLTREVIDFFQSKGWWFDEAAESYMSVIEKLGENPNTEFGFFYSHAEGNSNFVGGHGELTQFCWAALNTKYIENADKLRSALILPERFIVLTSFEGGGGYFYDKISKKVFYASLAGGCKFVEGVNPEWKSFSDFLDYFFDIS